MNAGTTARVMITIARMAQQLQQNQQAYWATQLALFCCEAHPEWHQVREDLEPLEFMRLETDIHKAIGITLGGGHYAEFLVQRATALGRKYQAKHKASWRIDWENA